MSKLKSAIDNLTDAVTDFTTLSVTTYTGDLKVVLTTNNTFIKLKDLDFDSVLQQSLNGAVAQGNMNLELVALNTHKFDGDGLVYRGEGLNDKLEKAHNEALTLGRETREGILGLVKDLL